MSLSDWLAIAQVVSLITVPALGGLISILHAANRRRWDNIENAIRETNRDHRKMQKRVARIETAIAMLRYDKIVPPRNKRNTDA